MLFAIRAFAKSLIYCENCLKSSPR